MIGGSSLTDSWTGSVPTGKPAEAARHPLHLCPFPQFTNAVGRGCGLGRSFGRGKALFIGANVLDNPGYPDCRPEYFEAFSRVVESGHPA
jgi:7-cyano-7-deazaguanine synthase